MHLGRQVQPPPPPARPQLRRRLLLPSSDEEEERQKGEAAPLDRRRARGFSLHLERPGGGRRRLSGSVDGLAITDEREGTPVSQVRVLGPGLADTREEGSEDAETRAGARAASGQGGAAEGVEAPPPMLRFSAEADGAAEGAARDGGGVEDRAQCTLSLARASILAASELPALMAASVAADPSLLPPHVPVPDAVLAGASLGAAPPTALAPPAVPAAPAALSRPSAADSLLLLDGRPLQFVLQLDSVALALPPPRSAPEGWTVAVGLSSSLDVDALPKFERVSVRLQPRLDCGALAPAAPPPLHCGASRWLQPSPLLMASSSLAAPTELTLQYAAHLAGYDAAFAGVSTLPRQGAAAPPTPARWRAAASAALQPPAATTPAATTPAAATPAAAAPQLERLERIVDLRAAPLRLSVSLSEMRAISARLGEVSSRAAPPDNDALEAEAQADADVEAEAAAAASAAAAAAPPDEWLTTPWSGEVPRLADPPNTHTVPTAGGPFVMWQVVAKQDLAYWSTRFLCKLLARKRKREAARAAAGGGGAPPLLCLRTEVRLRLGEMTLRLEPDPPDAASTSPRRSALGGSAGPGSLARQPSGLRESSARLGGGAWSSTAPLGSDAQPVALLEARLALTAGELVLMQSRLRASSAPSVRQLWDADVLQGSLQLRLRAEYRNLSLGVLEPALEQWPVSVSALKHEGAADVSLSVAAGELNLNVSRALLALYEALCREISGSREEAAAEAAGPGSRAAAGRDAELVVRLHNCSGLPLRVAVVRGVAAQPAAAAAPAAPPASDWRPLLPASPSDAAGEGARNTLTLTRGAPGGAGAPWLSLGFVGSRTSTSVSLDHAATHALSLGRPGHAAPHAVPFFDPLVCEVGPVAHGAVEVVIRSAAQLENQCTDLVQVHVFLPREAAEHATPRSAAGPASPPTQANQLAASEPEAAALEELHAVLEPAARLSLPVWAHARRAYLRLRRCVSNRWDEPVLMSDLLGAAARRGPSAIAAAGGSSDADEAMLHLPRPLHFFGLLGSTAWLPSPGSVPSRLGVLRGSPPSRPVADIRLGIVWRAALVNNLPAGVEVQAAHSLAELMQGDGDGARADKGDGLLGREAGGGEGSRPVPGCTGLVQVQRIGSGAAAELPIDHSVWCLDAAAADGSGGGEATAGSVVLRLRLPSSLSEGAVCSPWSTPFRLSRHATEDSGGSWMIRQLQPAAAGLPAVPPSRLAVLSLGASCSAHLALEPGAGDAPRLSLFAPYWLINKTGLRLAYHLQRAQLLLTDPEPPAAAATPPPPSAAHAAAAAAAEPSNPVPIMLGCGAGELVVLEVQAAGHQARVGGRSAAVGSLHGLISQPHGQPEARGGLGPRPGPEKDAEGGASGVGRSLPISMDSLGQQGEVLFDGGGVLGCAIEPAPGALNLLSSTVSVCPRCVARNSQHLSLLQPASQHPGPAGTSSSTGSPPTFLIWQVRRHQPAPRPPS